jgi:MerR family copper efflux transcriptional regulator
MKLSEIAVETGLPERLVRFLIAEGIVPPPEGGRRFARYDERHLRAIRRYLALKEAGLTLAAIRVLVANQDRDLVPIPVAEGVELRLHPDLLASGADPQPLIQRIAQILSERLHPKPETEKDRAHTRDGH